MSNDSEAEVEEAEEEQEQQTEEAAEEQAESGFQEGDFVRVDYTARTVEDGRLVDTTDPEVAEEEGIEEEHEFAPRTIVLGEGHIFPSVEDDVIGSGVGDTGSVVVPADEAFGEYDDDEVQTISKDKIPEDDRYPGAQVRVDGDEGFVETIIGGRARVDFNHPLAGEDVEYDWEVAEVVDGRTEKAEGLLGMFLDIDLNIWFQTDTVEEEQVVEDEETEGADADEEDDEESEPELETVEVEKESLYIEATPQLTMNQQWMMQKQQIGDQLIDLLGIDRIVIEEIIEGTSAGIPGMMGGMPGGGGGGLEEALEEADIDADELADELDE